MVGRLETQLLSGWNETIEWIDLDGERRKAARRQEPLMDQLRKEVHEPRAPKSSDGSKNANKASSKEPGNVRALHIIEDIECYMATAQMRMRHVLRGYADIGETPAVATLSFMANRIESELVASGQIALDETICDLHKAVRQARTLLSYDVPKSALRDTVCDRCSGMLIVAQDASSDVLCVGIEGMGGCGRKYRRTEWAKMLEARNALVDTMSAVIYTGRPAAMLYRWASEGRITRHGGRGQGQARWSLTELPQAMPGQPLAPWPKPPAIPLPTAHAYAHTRDSTPDRRTQGG